MDDSGEPGGAELELSLPPVEGEPSLAWPPSGMSARPMATLPSGGLTGFTTSLFVQAQVSEVQDVARVMEHTKLGAVLTLEHKGYRSQMLKALGAVDHTRRRTLSRNLLVDRNLYSGPKRKQAKDGLSQQWVDDQHAIMKLDWAMTDSGFSYNLRDVTSVLADSARMSGQVIVALPMSHELLRDQASEISDLVNGQTHPVAIMLEHELDPFDTPGVASALSHVIVQARPGVLLLRSDTSALGAISHGAAVGAIGTHTALRHIFPAQVTTGGGPEQLAFVIPDLLGFYRQRRFEQAYLRDPHLAAWRCSCWFCAGRDLTWIGNTPNKLRLRAGFQHSVAALADLGEQLAAGAMNYSQPEAWASMCDLAQIQHDAVSNPSGSPWEPKAALSHWRRATPAPTRAS